MSVAASVVLGQARSLLNDPGATNWTDTVLMPLLQIGHQELQVALRASDSPVMKGLVIDVALADDTTTVANPTSIIEPIRLWERTQASGDYTSYVLMTEVDDLPLVEPGGTLKYWKWMDETFSFLGSTAAQYLRIWYWKQITLPALNTDLIGFINGELYLSPRTAALASVSLGNQALTAALTSQATMGLAQVIAANRGRAVPASGAAQRP